MRHSVLWVIVALGIALIITVSPAIASSSVPTSTAPTQTFNVNTLAGKMASIEATQGLYIRASAYVQEEADADLVWSSPATSDPITPTFVLSSPLDGTTIAPPPVVVNQDTAAATQNEPAIAIDPIMPNRIVVGMNDYVTRTWTCSIGSTPCSALGDGYSGTYYSNDGGKTWCCAATDPSHLGTLIPGVERLAGGIYDAGGDPVVAFNSHGEVFFSGLGFDRTAAPDTVTVSKGAFDSSGALSWGMPTFINAVNSPSILNDKEWMAIDTHATSPFLDRIYVTWTRFIFNPISGRYVQSPIAFAFSSDDGATFSDPQLISSNVLYGQGSRPVVGPDGTLYVFWDASTRLATFDSTYMVKSTDGGLSWGQPIAIATLTDIAPPANTVFRVNSYPSAAVASDGTLYAIWNTEVNNTKSSAVYTADANCAYFFVGRVATQKYCHNAVVYSKSTDGGDSWSAPAPAFPSLEAATRTPVGYTGTPPAPRPVDQVYPAVGVASDGTVYVSSYAADVVSPWQTCAKPATPTAAGRINCLALDGFINNARLDYVITTLGSGTVTTLTTHPINTRYQFGGGFIGDYTDMAIDSGGHVHVVWTDTNNEQTVVWWYGFQFVPTTVHQQDIVMA